MNWATTTGAKAQGAPRWAVLFPGQGSQHQGMGQALLAAYPAAEARLKQFSQVVDTDLRHLLCEATITPEPVAVHLAMVAFGLVAWEFMAQEGGPPPALVAGHSLGEITALACAGVVSPEDALRLAQARGHCLDEAVREQPGAMLALVGAPLAELRQACVAWRQSAAEPPELWEANVNGPQQLVVSGALPAVSALAAYLENEGVRAMPLKTAGAFHTPLMHGAARRFAALAAGFSYHPPRLSMVSSMTGRLLTSGQGISTHLALQMARPVQWLATMRLLQQAQVTQVVEAGPEHGALASLARHLGGWQVRGLFAHPSTSGENP